MMKGLLGFIVGYSTICTLISLVGLLKLNIEKIIRKLTVSKEIREKEKEETAKELNEKWNSNDPAYIFLRELFGNIDFTSRTSLYKFIFGLTYFPVLNLALWTGMFSIKKEEK